MKTKNRLIEIYRSVSNKLSEYNELRKCYDSFFEFHKGTGLGKAYNDTYKKHEICLKLIYKKPF